MDAPPSAHIHVMGTADAKGAVVCGEYGFSFGKSRSLRERL